MFVSAFVPARSPRFLPSFVSHCHRLLFSPPSPCVFKRSTLVPSFFLPLFQPTFRARIAWIYRCRFSTHSFRGILNFRDRYVYVRARVCTVDVDLWDFLDGIYFFFFSFFPPSRSPRIIPLSLGYPAWRNNNYLFNTKRGRGVLIILSRDRRPRPLPPSSYATPCSSLPCRIGYRDTQMWLTFH